MNVRGYLAIAVAAGALLVGGAFYASHAAHERAVARGARMAQMLGCVSCHDANLNGHLVEDDPERALIWSTNLSRSLSGWSDSDIERAVRQGKRPDGTDILVMPVASFNPLPSGDMDDLIAWLRSIPAKFGPVALAAIKAGKAKTPAQYLAEDLAGAPVDLGPRHARGRMLARTLCSDCHAPGLTGWTATGQPGAPPDLNAAVGYDQASFARLLRTGTGANDKPNGMTEEARKRFPGLTDDEVAVLLAYLRARASRSVSASAS
jgi:mono/diheme cytochrome c family protein